MPCDRETKQRLQKGCIDSLGPQLAETWDKSIALIGF